jgi:large subunit ribosomal protein L46
VVLSRPPQITRDQTPFEKAFFFYQRRLNERLVLPFSRYFYFKAGTPADLEWKRKQAERLTPARDIGVYNAYSETAWNDELLVGAKESELETQAECLLSDAEIPGVGSDEVGGLRKETVERPMPRVTEADKKGDERSLDRRLDRTLYLLVKSSEGRWEFPASTLIGRENLHEVSPQGLTGLGDAP